ncbi:DUF4224 domain-containing protein [Entomomonas moraniae]|uniref:DUF4224 domain-containing protein n=1 Tax=Entomomonas moraniae TaxID=2213226 RepID=A0A3Q9JI40_9GAMM|nr:DUF4224 domain-containing protein [Entomomonas moraniae]AZS50051.1 DUF4224 domain-containing protein [Entomomonas moraniae]
MSEVLDDEDVYRLTRRKHLKPQREILDAMGIKYYIHPIDNIIIIPRSSLSINDSKKAKRQPKWEENG